ncbi:RAMP superfamily CRISPR-associated protein [Phormidium sp. CCY1219]|uniref:RAMP superfamily CRISPR-associated protein n=1 Tax=Phormidium sp. CCY1219 TaxID=2886104 RepID=UPI002D1ECE60|nr:RAMP superfamily CRISPR-associated protein [Phormidium sp. CCY1219]MEB3830789.1 RAMP superfamily CRISPR-associated protein [Phormidium sp. CCY1219]
MAIEWLICREPVHIGGADSSSRGNNNPIFRLSDRTPAIPGSSLRGALREGAEHSSEYQGYVSNWFGGKDENISPGYIALGWGWPVWWPVHVLGYGSWWVSCPAWLNRYQQLSQQNLLNLTEENIYATDAQLNGKTVFLRWLKLTNIQTCTLSLPAPSEVPPDRRIIVPSDSINLIVDMGLVRQPRVSLRDEPNDNGSLVKNLFAVEGLPPGAVFMTSWTIRNPEKVEQIGEWEKFLRSEHYLGGLWSVGYGRIAIAQTANSTLSQK